MRETNCGFANPSLLATWGPTIQVNIGFDKDWKATNPTAPPPIPGIKLVDALVDTGAGESCIDDLLATQLKLPVIDRRKVSGSDGAHEVNMYLAQIHIPALPHTIYGAFAGVHLAAGGQMHKALIGRTFLINFTMIYEGTTGNVIIRSQQ